MKKPERKDSFTGSERHAVNGIKLEPWTPDRSICAQAVGLVYPALSKEDWASVKRGGTYPGAVRDVALTLFICTLKPEEVLELEAQGAVEAKKRSTEWAAKQGIHDQSKQPFWDALGKCMEIWNEVNNSVTVPTSGGNTYDDEESGNE